MPLTSDAQDRLQRLEEHVTSQDKASPGLLLRMDRVENLMRMGVALAGLGVGWKLIDAWIAISALRSALPLPH